MTARQTSAAPRRGFTLVLAGLALVFAVVEIRADRPVADGRVIIEDTTKLQTRWVGKIVFDSPDGGVRTEGPYKGTRKQSGGTGALIGPRHVLTAAHVIWNTAFLPYGDKDGFPPRATDMYFIPGLNGEKKPFGEAKVVGIYMQKQFQVESKKGGRWNYERQDRDIAVLLLDRDISKQTGGHFRYAALSDVEVAKLGTAVQSSGYDSDLDPYVARLQVRRHGRIHRWHRRIGLIDQTDLNMYYSYSWKVVEGASGGPVWIVKDGAPTVIGVNSGYCTWWNDATPAFSYGVFLTEGYVRWIDAYCK